MLRCFTIFSIILLMWGCTPQNDNQEPAWSCSESEELELLEAYGFSDTELVVIHCDALKSTSKWTAEDIKRFFKEERGWSRPGYTYWIDFDGKVHPLWQNTLDCLNEYKENTYGARGHNHKAIHIAYKGGSDKNGKPKDTRTKAQKQALENLISVIRNSCPDVEVIGHNELSAKACPSFHVDY